MRGCPYCPYLGDRKGSRTHLYHVHPNKPRPSDEDWPGWREVESTEPSGGELTPLTFQ